MNLKRFVVFNLLLLLVLSLTAQGRVVKLPYKTVGGKMLVEMAVNGVVRPFIFDTGAARTSLTGEACREMGLAATDSIMARDATGKIAYYKLVKLASVTTPGGGFNFTGYSVMILPEYSPFACFEVDGMIGSDLLARLIVEIDGKEQMITLQTAEQESPIASSKMLPFMRAGMPIIPLSAGAGKSQLVCLFDTGCPSLLSLKKSDYEALHAASALELVAEGNSVGAASIGGQAKASVLQRVRFPLLKVGDAQFKQVTAETATPPYTLLGLKLLNYGKVTLDYPRQRFYFEAYEQENDCTENRSDVGLTLKNRELVVGSYGEICRRWWNGATR